MLISQRETGYLGSIISDSLNNRYTLKLSDLSSLSIVSVVGRESLNTPWRYEIIFTSPNKQLRINHLLSQPASLTFEAPSLAK